MMGGAAFTLLKTGRAGAKSAKQVEIRLAILPKILRIAGPEAKKSSRGGRERTYDYCDLRQFPYDMANSPGVVPFVI
jgi:hypothetical protein